MRNDVLSTLAVAAVRSYPTHGAALPVALPLVQVASFRLSHSLPPRNRATNVELGGISVRSWGAEPVLGSTATSTMTVLTVELPQHELSHRSGFAHNEQREILRHTSWQSAAVPCALQVA